MSESQKYVLLGYDSPPETPSQMRHMILSNDASNYNKVPSESFNNIVLNNREQLVTQMESQIDFSIFDNDKENESQDITLSSYNMQSNENVESVLMFSQNTGYINLSSCEETKEFFNDDKSLENSCERNQKLNFETNKEFRAENKLTNSANKSNAQDLEKIDDDIFESFDFVKFDANCSNINFSYKTLNSREQSNIIFCNNKKSRLNTNLSPLSQRHCQLEKRLKKYVLQPNDEVVSSCPISIQTPNSLKSPTITANKLKEGSLNDVMIIDNVSVVDSDEIFHNESCGLLNKDVSLEMEKDNASLIPFSIKQLFDIVKADNSDLAFIYALSAQLCQDRVPMECFVTLKMTLLLSLVSIGNDPDRPPLPVVAIANDTYMTDYLMINIGKLATRFVGPSIETKLHTSCGDWFEADPMLLAQGGVYYVGDWNRLKLKRSECIFKTIECSTVAVEKSTLNYALESAIWTHWRSYKYNSKDQQTFNKFLKLFGIPVFVSDDSHEALVDYTLEQSSIRVFESTIDHLSVNEDDMRKFLVYVSQCKVNITPEASTLLKNYFVASRSCMQDCLTKQSYIALKQLAESFCKLSMRKDVSSDDVLAAIILCEHSIENIFNCRRDSPAPHFGSFSSVRAVDEYLTDFKKWIDSFLNKLQEN